MRSPPAQAHRSARHDRPLEAKIPPRSARSTVDNRPGADLAPLRSVKRFTSGRSPCLCTLGSGQVRRLNLRNELVRLPKQPSVRAAYRGHRALSGQTYIQIAPGTSCPMECPTLHAPPLRDCAGNSLYVSAPIRPISMAHDGLPSRSDGVVPLRLKGMTPQVEHFHVGWCYLYAGLVLVIIERRGDLEAGTSCRVSN